jgi:hypothetical protein
MTHIEPDSPQDVPDVCGALILVLAGLITVAYWGFVGMMIVHFLRVPVIMHLLRISESCFSN